ncbi:MAG TPA: hypothetical protein VHB79_17460 [Polyangiaceae bacterium]|nr:hypothetical protein [Polyangiaceae bacterium]
MAATDQNTGQAPQNAASHVDFDAKESEEVMRSVNRLPIVDRACHERCSFAVDYDGKHWLVDVAYDRSPRYAAAYQRYLDNRGPEPACP